jgi:hypothetical protein
MVSQSGRTLRRRSERAGALAEFGPVLFIFFIIVLLPLMGLFTFIDGVATVAFATSVAARECGTATTRAQAIANMQAAADKIIGGPLGKFAKISPSDSSGMSLFVLEIPVGTGSRTEYEGTNQIANIDTNSNFYEYQVRSKYEVTPLFVPKAFEINWASASHVEHPNGLNTVN